MNNNLALTADCKSTFHYAGETITCDRPKSHNNGKRVGDKDHGSSVRVSDDLDGRTGTFYISWGNA